MPESVTAAILLGASSFPRHSYPAGPAFLRSKQDFCRYLQDWEGGLAVPDDAILDLFNSHYEPSSQLKAIGKFLDRFNDQVGREATRNLIVYYVGHGFFPGLRQEFHVALWCVETGYESTTSLKIAELAEVIKQKARAFRRFIFLDCCFAAEALAAFQGGAEDAIAVKARLAFEEDAPRRPVAVPRRGTALFCAADKDNVALSPKQYPRTMFTDALLGVLVNGDRGYPRNLTLAEVRELTWERLSAEYSEPVRPVLHSPDQSEGDIAAKVLLFPNAGYQPAPEKTGNTATDPGTRKQSVPPKTDKNLDRNTRPAPQDTPEPDLEPNLDSGTIQASPWKLTALGFFGLGLTALFFEGAAFSANFFSYSSGGTFVIYLILLIGGCFSAVRFSMFISQKLWLATLVSWPICSALFFLSHFFSSENMRNGIPNPRTDVIAITPNFNIESDLIFTSTVFPAFGCFISALVIRFIKLKDLKRLLKRLE